MLKDMPEKLPGKALDDDALENVTGGTGSSGDKVECDGTVVAVQRNGVFQVIVDNGHTINAGLSGQMRMNYVRVMVGDRVRVSYSPGADHGLITWRYK